MYDTVAVMYRNLRQAKMYRYPERRPRPRFGSAGLSFFYKNSIRSESRGYASRKNEHVRKMRSLQFPLAATWREVNRTEVCTRLAAVGEGSRGRRLLVCLPCVCIWARVCICLSVCECTCVSMSVIKRFTAIRSPRYVQQTSANGWTLCSLILVAWTNAFRERGGARESPDLTHRHRSLGFGFIVVYAVARYPLSRLFRCNERTPIGCLAQVAEFFAKFHRRARRERARTVNCLHRTTHVRPAYGIIYEA